MFRDSDGRRSAVLLYRLFRSSNREPRANLYYVMDLNKRCGRYHTLQLQWESGQRHTYRRKRFGLCYSHWHTNLFTYS